MSEGIMEIVNHNSGINSADIAAVSVGFLPERKDSTKNGIVRTIPSFAELENRGLQETSSFCKEILYRDIANSVSVAKKTLPANKELGIVLNHIVATLLRLYDKDRDYYRILIRDVFFEPSKANSQMEGFVKEQLEFIAYMIELWKSKRRVDSDVNSQRVASLIFFVYLGVLREFLSHPEMSVADAAESFSDCLKILRTGIEDRNKGNGVN